MIIVGSCVINKNELRVKSHPLTEDKFVLTDNIYLVHDLDCDGFGQIKMVNINNGKICYCNNKNCLVEVWG